MPYSSVLCPPLSVTKNPDQFCSCCISQTWTNGFLHSFKLYFSPPDFNISYKKNFAGAKNVENDRKCPKSPKMPKIAENAKNHQKCQKSPKIPTITKNVKNHRKMPKITEKCQKSLKMPKIPKITKNHPR